MYKLNTTDISEWMDALHSKHQLPLDIILYREKNFFSAVQAIQFENIKGASFADVSTSTYHGRYKSINMKGDNESFLLTHSFGQFSGIQEEKNLSDSNFSFCIDLSKNFDGYFHNEGRTKSVVIPFSSLDPKAIDHLRKTPLENNHLYFDISQILKGMNITDTPLLLENKIKTLINLLSICDLSEKYDLENDFIEYIEKMHYRNCQTDLDTLSTTFLINRGRIKHILPSNSNSVNYMQSMSNLKSNIAKIKKLIIDT